MSDSPSAAAISALTAVWLPLLEGLLKARIAMGMADAPEPRNAGEKRVLLALSDSPAQPVHSGLSAQWELVCARLKEEHEFCAALHRVGVTGFALFAVLLALTPELDGKYGSVFAWLQEKPGEARPALNFALELYAMLHDGGRQAHLGACLACAPLWRHILMPQERRRDRKPLPAAVLSLRETALHLALALPGMPEMLGRVCAELPPLDRQDALMHRDLHARALRFARERELAGVLQLVGGSGSGRRFCAQVLAGGLGRRVLCVKSSALAALSDERRDAVLHAAASWCFLSGAIPVILDGQDLAAPDACVASFLADEIDLVVFCSEKPFKLRHENGARFLQIEIPACTIAQKRELWVHFTAKASLPLEAGLDLTRMAGYYELTPGQIKEVVFSARADCLSRGETALGTKAISRGVRRLCGARLGAVAQPLRSGFTWDDLILGEEPARLLGAVCERIRNRQTVQEEWGFASKLPYGKGVSALLYGPPGTGKTMTAQVLAGEFGLDAYRVDLSQVMDKYIGETEKKLGELFDAARDSNSILFFDEADALFARRTEVGDSKDRYANVETAYLLQRMEEHDGVCILATNTVQNLDEAFKRRIGFIIHLPLPDARVRERIWRGVFPQEAPLHPSANLTFFAERFELSGASIKNIALGAAYLAATEKSKITRELITRALRDEYQKTGRVLMEHELY